MIKKLNVDRKLFETLGQRSRYDSILKKFFNWFQMIVIKNACQAYLFSDQQYLVDH